MPVAEIIAIGTELLLGEIQDTNTHYLARSLRDAGVDLYRTMVVGDNVERIASAIKESLQRAQIIITTGGLGPTVDDPTRQAVALAIGVPTEFRPDLWDQIQSRFQRYNRQATDNNRRQAYVPTGAIPVENPVGTAPAFIVETQDRAIISLPGVPREMEHLFNFKILPYLRDRYNLKGTIKARVLHTAGMGESQVDALIGDLETMANPTAGLLAHAGQVDIRLTAKAETVQEADRMIQELEGVVRERLGDAIFGTDVETLETAVATGLLSGNYHLGVVECDLESELVLRLEKAGLDRSQARILDKTCTFEQLNDELRCLQSEGKAEVCLGVSLQRGSEKQLLSLTLLLPDGEVKDTRSYGGPPSMGTIWAVNTSMDFLRRNLKQPGN